MKIFQQRVANYGFHYNEVYDFITKHRIAGPFLADTVVTAMLYERWLGKYDMFTTFPELSFRLELINNDGTASID